VSLADWHFIPWTLQYFVGGGLALIISFYLLSKNPKSWVYRYFFLFGLSVSTWEFLSFFHRNAPTADLSLKFFAVSSSFYILSLSFLLLMLLTFRGEKLTYSLVSIPALAIGIFLILTKPFDIFWTDFGWSYKLVFTWSILPYTIAFIGYIVSITIVGWLLIKESKVATLRKKFVLMSSGFIFFYLIGFMISNLLLLPTGFPPLGGIFPFLTFLCIAYAISLPTEKIESLRVGGMKKFSKDYLYFLNKLLEVAPGKELGESLVRLKDSLPTLGLSDVIEFERGKIYFRPEEPKFDPSEIVDKSLDFMKQQGWALSAVKPFTDLFVSTYRSIKSKKDADKWFEKMLRKHGAFLYKHGILDAIADKSLDFMKQQGWALPAAKSFTDVFVSTYKAIKSKSKKDADEWFERMLRKHGAFLQKHEILDIMPKGVRIPGIFKEIEVGKSYLVREDRPRRCLEMLKEAINYGFKGLCFTMRYPPQKVRNEYGLEGVDIIWLKFKPEKGVKTLAPDKLDELEEVISEFIAPGGAIVLVDAFDQIKVVNGFEKSMEFLQKIKVAAAKSGANLLISMRPESVWEKESAAIAKITKLHQSGPTWTSFELL